MSINQTRNDLLKELTVFYTPSNFAQIYPILTGEDVLSMSIINFVVTNFAKDFSSYIRINDNIVYISKSYKSQLNKNKKQCFDPFCREPKIYFKYDKTNNKSILTSVAQLNFYRWAIEIRLIDFIRENHRLISEYNIAKSKIISHKSSSHKSTSLSELSTSERVKNSVIVRKINTNFLSDDYGDECDECETK